MKNDAECTEISISTEKNARQSENNFGIERGLFNIKLNTYSLHTRQKPNNPENNIICIYLYNITFSRDITPEGKNIIVKIYLELKGFFFALILITQNNID